MLELPDLLNQLGYSTSPHYRRSEREFEPETAHLFRSARNAHVDGMYVVQAASSRSASALPARPVVIVAVAATEQQAREIHRSMWNLSAAPFLLIVLPHQIRVYTAFEYDPELGKGSRRSGRERGLLRICDNHLDVVSQLAHMTAASIDSGQIWESDDYRNWVDTRCRVDTRLLENLSKLDEHLQTRMGLGSDIAHALIGKYVYIRYLRDRNILSDEWLEEQGIDRRSVFDREATVAGLARLVHALEIRFNGKIFPLDFEGDKAPKDWHVQLVASVFKGDKIESDAAIKQLHLNFQAYQFDYIPIETLSSVYEQFIDNRRLKGAIYTPEVLADYLLSEMSAVKKLTPGMAVLDPACGSGVFLVLALRRLIEQHIAAQADGRIAPSTLVGLLANLYGVERELDACYVTEFSLLLTILHYIQPPELHKHREFQFPSLHKTQIFHGDFFEDSLDLWRKGLQFDWVVGNPPWVPAERAHRNGAAGEKEGTGAAAQQEKAARWMEANQSSCPVGDRSVAQAFSWRVSALLKDDGLAGLVMPAASLVNLKSQKYRAAFFTAHEVFRIANFANFRRFLFGGRSKVAAATMVYTTASEDRTKVEIVHYGPFSINQIPHLKSVPWALVIDEDEIKTISPQEAEKGNTLTWKLALWGSHRDRRALDRLRWLYPTTLEMYCELQGWGTNLPQEGLQSRAVAGEGTDRAVKSDKLANTRVLSLDHYDKGPRYRFWLPDNLLVPNTNLYLRRGITALRINKAPHIFISAGWDLVTYSDIDFIIPPRQMGVSASTDKDKADQLSDDETADRRRLKALCLYLNSTVVKYYLFFHVPEWGIDRRRDSVVVSEVRKIPTPVFTDDQIVRLATLYDQLSRAEQAGMFYRTGPLQASLFDEPGQDARDADTDRSGLDIEELHKRQQKQIDDMISDACQLPEDIQSLASDFVHNRLLLNEDKKGTDQAIRIPTTEEFTQYAKQLQAEIIDFLMGEFRPSVDITWSKDLTECIVELSENGQGDRTACCTVQEGTLSQSQVLESISADLRQRISQWAYVQRGLRLYDGPRIYLYKATRLIDWTRSQAMNDAADIIAYSMQASATA